MGAMFLKKTTTKNFQPRCQRKEEEVPSGLRGPPWVFHTTGVFNGRGAASGACKLPEEPCWSPRTQVELAIFNRNGLCANSYPIRCVPCSRPPATRVQKAPDWPVDAGWCWGRHRPLRTEFRLFCVEFLGVFQCTVLKYSCFFSWYLYFFTSIDIILPVKEAVTPSKQNTVKPL